MHFLLINATPTSIAIMALIAIVLIYLFWQKLGQKSSEMDMQRTVVDALAAGRYNLALQLARDLERAYPDNFMVQELKASALIGDGNIPQAIQELGSALQKSPDKTELLRTRAYARFLIADYRGALSDYQNFYKGKKLPMAAVHEALMLAFDQRISEAQNILGSLSGKGNPKKRRQQSAYQEAPRNPFESQGVNPDNPMRDSQAPEDANETQSAPLNIISPRVEDMADIGLANYLVGQQEAAFEIWKQLIASPDKRPHSTLALLYRANAYISAHRYSEALDDLNHLLSISPNHPQAHYLSANVHRILNNKDTAAFHLETAQRLGHTQAGTGRDGDRPSLITLA